MLVDALICLHLRLEKQRSRRQLKALPEHQLGDIGKTRVEAEREANRSFWG